MIDATAALATLMALIVFVFVAALFGRWLLEPVNRAAGHLNAPTRFILTDFLWLMIQLQVMLATVLVQIREQVPQNGQFVILGILAVTIVPQFVGMTQEAKVSSAKSSVADLETAVERFHMNMDRYPTSEEGLKALVDPPSTDAKSWRGPYIKLVRPDPWGSPYQYKFPGLHHPTTFDVWSRGGDKADGGEGDAADIGNW